MKERLKALWNEVMSSLNLTEELSTPLFEELIEAYSHTSRAYHNLDHIDYMLGRALTYRSHIEDFESFVLAIFFHDVVYHVMKKNNEAQSAKLATQRLTELQVAPAIISKVESHIMATKIHDSADSMDTALLLDIDLGVLGEDRERYAEYSRQIRTEYSYYPDILYNKGRKGVLNYFISMEKIFKSPAIEEGYEVRAKANLIWEKESLS
jgi:predicted metal-dependent HD superfamily phosphohydrolase